MIVQASITGLFKTLLIIIGVLTLLRFLGQLMNAKRNIAEEQALNRQKKSFEKEKARSQVNFGKTKVINREGGVNAEDIDFEEVE